MQITKARAILCRLYRISKIFTEDRLLVRAISLLVLLFVLLVGFFAIAGVAGMLIIFASLLQVFFVAARYGSVVRAWRRYHWWRGAFLYVGCLLDVGWLCFVVLFVRRVVA